MILRFGILTISDRSSRGERADLSGPALADFVRARGWDASLLDVVPDDRPQIAATLTAWCARGDLDVLLTTGGTGFAPRDVTPEATRDILERDAPGLAEAIRAESLKITPHAMLSRGLAGIRGKTILINLPGSPKGAVESLQVVADVLEHAVQLLQEDVKAEKGHEEGRKPKAGS
ncbi:MAG TPA: MogA/MoaB family molybdenum cofactor biosynthesis protein [Anaerolineales bacterium]|nr:MogA/MoaB family molybdenum cofactor biosynthesis protein [Anaerolineales bacterium]